MQQHKIKVYSTPSCPWCHIAKNFLKEHGFEFQEINVAEDEKAAEEMIKKSGQMGVPVIEIDDQIIIGFNEQKIKKILGIR
ncbi:MAG: glutaredoxin family protein [Candidatus Pacearchaeota archaeon]